MAWNIEDSSYWGDGTLIPTPSSPGGVTVSPDGIHLFVASRNDDFVYHYTMSPAWDVTSVVYISSLDTTRGTTTLHGITVSPDGTKLYAQHRVDDRIDRYDLSTAWDLTSASFHSTFDYSAQDTNTFSMDISPDGTKLFLLGDNPHRILRYDLLPAWDIASPTYVGETGDVETAEMPIPYGIVFSADGTKMFMSNWTPGRVSRYDMTVPWDLTTFSYHSAYLLEAGGVGGAPGATDVTFSPDGTKMLVSSTGGGIYRYQVITPPPVLAGEFTLRVQPLGGGPFIGEVPYTRLTFRERLNDPGSIEFDVPRGHALKWHPNDTVKAWDIRAASPVARYDVSAQMPSDPYGIAFSADGTKMFAMDYWSPGEVFRYDLSTAWDVTTASYHSVKDISAEDESYYTGLEFSPDGTKMFVIGNWRNSVWRYDLSSAWDITSASYVSTKDITAQDVVPIALALSTDGTKMYVSGQQYDSIFEYDLSPAWDVASATHVSTLDISVEAVQPFGMDFSPDGTIMIIMTFSWPIKILRYNLSTAWDVTTALHAYDYYDSVTPGGNPFNLTFKPDGTKFYIMNSYPNYEATQYDISPTTQPFLAPGMVEVAVYDGEVCMWEGRLTAASETRNDDILTFLGEGIMGYLDDQVAGTLDFTGRKSNEIVSDIINDMQTQAGANRVDNIDLSLLVNGETHYGVGVTWDVWGVPYLGVEYSDYKTHISVLKDFLGYRGGMDFFIEPGTRIATPVFPPIGYSSDERDTILHAGNTIAWDRGFDAKEQAGEIVVYTRIDGTVVEAVYLSTDSTVLYAPRKKVVSNLSLETTAAVALEATSIAAERGIPKSTYSFTVGDDPFGNGTLPTVGEPMIARVESEYDPEEVALRIYGVDTSEDSGIRTYIVYAELANDFLGL